MNKIKFGLGMVVATFVATLALVVPVSATSVNAEQNLLLKNHGVRQTGSVVIDSALTREQALGDNVVPVGEPKRIHKLMKPYLAVVPVIYHGYDNKIHIGQIVVHKSLKFETQVLFARMFMMKFPIKSVIPQAVFGYDDQKSMGANNSSNYRPEEGSEHRKGSAFDLNPMQNPFDITGYDPTEPVQPAGATYNPSAKGTITMNSPMRKYWASLNWEWGGNWGNPNADPQTDFFKEGFFDYQHFQLNYTRYDDFEAQLPADV